MSNEKVSVFKDPVLYTPEVSPKHRFEFRSCSKSFEEQEIFHLLDLQFNEHILGVPSYDIPDRIVRVLVLETPTINRILVGNLLKRVPLETLEIYHNARHILLFKTLVSSHWVRHVMDNTYWAYDVQLNFLNVDFRSEEL